MMGFKELVLAAITALISIAVFWLWKEKIPVILDGSLKDYLVFILPAAGLAVSAALCTILSVFTPGRAAAYGGALAGIGVPFLFLEAASTVIGIFLLVLLLVGFAVHRSRKEYALSLGFSLSRLSKSGMPTWFSAASLLISLFYLAGLSEEKALEVFFPRALTEYTARALADPGSPLARSLGIPSLPEELLTERATADIFHNAVKNNLEALLGPYRTYLPLAAAAALFFALKTLTIPLYYVSILIAFLLIRMMLWGNILKREVKEMKIERLTL